MLTLLLLVAFVATGCEDRGTQPKDPEPEPVEEVYWVLDYREASSNFKNVLFYRSNCTEIPALALQNLNGRNPECAYLSNGFLFTVFSTSPPSVERRQLFGDGVTLVLTERQPGLTLTNPHHVTLDGNNRVFVFDQATSENTPSDNRIWYTDFDFGGINGSQAELWYQGGSGLNPPDPTLWNTAFLPVRGVWIEDALYWAAFDPHVVSGGVVKHTRAGIGQVIHQVSRGQTVRSVDRGPSGELLLAGVSGNQNNLRGWIGTMSLAQPTDPLRIIKSDWDRVPTYAMYSTDGTILVLFEYGSPRYKWIHLDGTDADGCSGVFPDPSSGLPVFAMEISGERRDTDLYGPIPVAPSAGRWLVRLDFSSALYNGDFGITSPRNAILVQGYRNHIGEEYEVSAGTGEHLVLYIHVNNTGYTYPSDNPTHCRVTRYVGSGGKFEWEDSENIDRDFNDLVVTVRYVANSAD